MVSTITPALVELLAKTLNSLKMNVYIYYKYCIYGFMQLHKPCFGTPSPFSFPLTQCKL